MRPELSTLLSSLLVMGFEDTSLENNLVKPWLDHGLGGVVLFDVDYQYLLRSGESRAKNIINPHQVKSLNAEITAFNPGAFISIDVEGGDETFDAQSKGLRRSGVNRLKHKYGFAHTLSAKQMGELYSQNQPELVWQNCRLIAKTLKDSGFNLVFAPVVDIDVNPLCPIIGKLDRSFSERASVVIDCARIFIEACKEQKIQCVLKHFPGHGSALDDTHLGFVDITQHWSEKELQPYIELANHCGMVMMSHLIHRDFDDKPVSISQKWVQRLRNLGFTGVIISDDIQMDGLWNFINVASDSMVTEDDVLHQTLLATFKAGSDMVVIGNQLKPFDPMQFQKCLQFLQECVSQGELSYEQLLTSYERVGAIKQGIDLPYSQVVREDRVVAKDEMLLI